MVRRKHKFKVAEEVRWCEFDHRPLVVVSQTRSFWWFPTYTVLYKCEVEGDPLLGSIDDVEIVTGVIESQLTKHV